ncbi:hypothetical protein CDD82_3084 [Ophiocordyceps australis]|uniref:DNA topoisomerase (ATP-hydrolyzing) n=1 Tax=Ophiocordyceps australis TaxID=1399860 RepID=A0A2C5Z908_9HYPO|nr:hypothetical protein CDD82_3084 [Ophiocordyceps australis]
MSETRQSARNMQQSDRATGALVARIEEMLEAVVSRIAAGQEMSIEMASRRRSGRNARSLRPVRFPGRNLAEAQKFARVLLILQLSHDALVAGRVLTKRHIFYQHQELFGKQRVVDDLVDDLALTLDVSREDLRIVASVKGLVVGPLVIRSPDGAAIDTSLADTGTPIPTRQSVSSIEYGNLRWILVIEKDAIFRSLATCRFWQTSTAGTGLLITAKGYPDLNTRLFLHMMHQQRPQLPILVLADFDPDGLGIFRCYRFGSEALAHEASAHNPKVRWLGIKSHHIQSMTTLHRGGLSSGSSMASHEQVSTPAAAASRTSISSINCREPVSLLTMRDRRNIRCALASIARQDLDHVELVELRRELQVMLMMGVKAEIQWLDEAGDITQWLSDKISRSLQDDE